MVPDPLDILRRPDPDVVPDSAFVAGLRARLVAEAGRAEADRADRADRAGNREDDRPADRDRPDPPMVIDMDTLARTRHNRRKLGVLGAAVAAVAALVAVLVVATRDDADTVDVVDTPVTSTTSSAVGGPGSSTTAPVPSTAPPVPTTATTPSTAAADAALGLPPIRSAADSAVTSAVTASKPAQVVTGGSSVWVIPNLGPIQRFDAATGALLGTVPLQLDDFPTRPAVAFGSLWMATEWNDQLNRIDLATGEIVARITIPGGLRGVGGAIPDGPAAAEDGVWVLSDATGLDRTLLRIDPATNTVARTLPAPRGADVVGYGFGALWVSHVPLQGGPGIYRVEPATGDVLADIEITGGAFMIRVAFGSVWTSGVEPDAASGGYETLNRIDPATNAVVAKIPYAAVATEWHSDIAEAGGSLWISSKTALLVQIDPAQNRIVDRFVPSTGGGGVAADATSVWFTAWDDARLHRLPIA